MEDDEFDYEQTKAERDWQAFLAANPELENEEDIERVLLQESD